MVPARSVTGSLLFHQTAKAVSNLTVSVEISSLRMELANNANHTPSQLRTK